MLCDELYNELCQLLTNFETGERPVDANDFYSLLVKIQIRAYGLFVGTIFYRSRHSRLH